jgi:hypothetical protein
MATDGAGVQYIKGYTADGVSIGEEATDKTGMHGRATAQYSNIAVVTASITSNGITACWDVAAARINSLIAALTQKGLVAAS